MAELELKHPLGAPPELLWRYLSTSEGLACWQADTVEGSLDEGSFSLRWPQLGARMDLSVAELEAPRKIVLRAGDHVLSMTLAESVLELEHGGLHPEDDLEGLKSSWRTALSLLDIAATNHPRQSRTVRWLFRPIEAQAELAHYYFTDPQGLRSWLGESADSLAANNDFAIDCDGTRLSGKVLCAERDVCLRVDEMSQGALTFRTLPGPNHERIAAIGISSWTGTPDQSLVDLLERALGRLSRVTETARPSST